MSLRRKLQQEMIWGELCASWVNESGEKQTSQLYRAEHRLRISKIWFVVGLSVAILSCLTFFSLNHFRIIENLWISRGLMVVMIIAILVLLTATCGILVYRHLPRRFIEDVRDLERHINIIVFPSLHQYQQHVTMLVENQVENILYEETEMHRNTTSSNFDMATISGITRRRLKQELDLMLKAGAKFGLVGEAKSYFDRLRDRSKKSA